MSRARLLAVGVIGLGLACSILAKAGRAQGDLPPDLARIVEAWKKRQDLVKSAKFVWTGRETITKGYLTSFHLRLGVVGERALKSMGISPTDTVPPRDTTFELQSKLLLDGQQMRYEYEDRHWSAKQGEYVPGYAITTFDGKVCKDLRPTGTPHTPYPSGSIRKAARHTHGRSMVVAPLLMTYRSHVPDLCVFNVQELELTGRQDDVGGKRCLELRRRGKGIEERLWVDPSRDYVIVRYLDTADGRPTLKIDVQFRFDPTHHVWVPQSWDMFNFRADGTLTTAARVRVTDSQINVGVDPSEFDVVFPLGTVVNDEKSNKQYVIKPTGEKRPIVRGDEGASYQQVIESAPGEALGKRPSGSVGFPWPLVVAVCVFMVSITLLWRRRMAQKSIS